MASVLGICPRLAAAWAPAIPLGEAASGGRAHQENVHIRYGRRSPNPGPASGGLPPCCVRGHFEGDSNFLEFRLRPAHATSSRVYVGQHIPSNGVPPVDPGTCLGPRRVHGCYRRAETSATEFAGEPSQARFYRRLTNSWTFAVLINRWGMSACQNTLIGCSLHLPAWHWSETHPGRWPRR